MKKTIMASCVGMAFFTLTAHAQGEYATKTLYQAQQNPKTYEAAPRDFKPVYTQLLARHGARGLTSLSDDAALHNLWLQAKQTKGLTPLGEKLGAAIEELMQANMKIGYGNMTALGKREHQALAKRMWQRLQPMFDDALSQPQPRIVQWQSSGVGRAVDSKDNFVASLGEQDARLKNLMQPTAKIVGDSGTDTGINHYELYFHALKKADAQLTPNSPYAIIYQNSEAHQAFLKKNEQLKAVLNQTQNTKPMQQAAQKVLQRLFTPDFMARLNKGEVQVSDAGTFSGVGTDGQMQTFTGSGKTNIRNAVDAVDSLYSLFSVAPAFEDTLRSDWRQFMSRDAAALWAQASDAEDFYEKSASFADVPHHNIDIAQALLNDFFKEIDGLKQPSTAHLAKLRFSHAEVVIPFAGILGLKGMSSAMPTGQTYSYRTNAWRGENVAPFAANVQWDVYQNSKGRLLVKMLYNERETLFKPACAAARVAQTRHFYDYEGLKRCYLGAQ